MKKFTFLSFFTALTFAAAVIISGCTKEGPQGPPGEDGVDGEDGTAGCIECHDDSQNIFAATIQWEASKHATGGNFERNGSSCAPCHTSRGFLEVVETGGMETAATIEHPTPPNCYTCHQIHETYTPQDWQLTKSEPTELWINNEVVELGKGNLCAQCHQPRVPSPMWDMTVDDSISIGYFRWGPHYGTQSTILAGTGGYEFEGSYSYSNSVHSNIENSCVTCHMAEPYGTQAGGHTMDMNYMYHGSAAVNVAGCYTSGCHSGQSEQELRDGLADWGEDVDEMMANLRSELLERNVIDSSNYLVEGTHHMEEVGAAWNFKLVQYDKSKGAHNYKYTRALLSNSLEALQD